jgi:acyl carrier protein
MMDLSAEVIRTLDDVLGLGGRSGTFSHATPLLGAVPELDSMAVVALMAALEDRLGVSFPDDEVDGATFATVGSLVDFVAARAGA